MSKNILLHFVIPLSDDVFGPSMTFNKWIPREENPIEFKKEQFNLQLWIDKDCVFPKTTDEEIASWVNIMVNKIKVEIQIQNIDDELADFIYDERESSRSIHHGIQPNNEIYDDFNSKFNQLGLDAVKLTYEICNRLISYVRNEKGQYLLESLTYDKENLHSVYVRADVQAKIDDGEWFRWNPYHTGVTMITFGDNKESIIEDDWSQIIEFVGTKKRINLANELLSNSMSLLFKYGHRRSAVIEAVTALEVALIDFSKKPNLKIFYSPTNLERVDVANLDNQVKHLGVSGSTRYLLPILFTERMLSTEVLKKCQQAMGVRNNIVHAGQRDIKTDLAEELVLALKQCSEILMEYTIIE